MTPQSYRYMGTVGSHLNYPRTEYGAPTESSAHDRASRKTHFESRLHADLAMFTNDTWHRVPCRSVSVSNFLCTSVLYNNYIQLHSVPGFILSQVCIYVHCSYTRLVRLISLATMTVISLIPSPLPPPPLRRGLVHTFCTCVYYPQFLGIH